MPTKEHIRGQRLCNSRVLKTLTAHIVSSQLPFWHMVGSLLKYLQTSHSLKCNFLSSLSLPTFSGAQMILIVVKKDLEGFKNTVTLFFLKTLLFLTNFLDMLALC